MEENNKKVEIKIYLIFGFCFIFGIFILGRVLYIQLAQSDKYENFIEKNNVKKEEYFSRRGNIYSEKGYLMATSVSKYDIRLDLVTVDDKLFKEKISALSDSLSNIYPNLSKREWQKKLTDLKYKKKSRYYSLAKKISYSEYKRLKNLPIFDRGKNKGGFIVEQYLNRGLPLKGTASRFIGYEDYRGKAGLEGAYSVHLKGRKGERLVQKIVSGEWKSLDVIEEPKEGGSITTTINIHFQNKAHSLLKQQLDKFEADHGCVVVMEVATGEIKAISNLYRAEKGVFYEKRNYAIYEAIEPGSTFKLMSVLAMLESGKVNKNTTIDIGDGTYKVYNKVIRDDFSIDENKITLEQAFEMSSNVGISKLVYENYKKNPSEFIDKLYKMGLGKKLDLEIKGEGIPKIPSPQDSRWSGISLAWISYGYEVLMTPLQVLTFYNAIANDGKMLKPLFVKEIQKPDNSKTTFTPKIIKETIASEKNIRVVQELLRRVVTNGTAKSINEPNYNFSGKTGTTQQGYWKNKNDIEYISSFAGYFPSEKPKYSCIVVIHNPNKKLDYYGYKVAAPVFKDLAKYIYKTITEDDVLNLSKKQLTEDLSQKIPPEKNTPDINPEIMPDLLGLPSYKAISISENLGLNVKIEGNGIIREQTITKGEKIKKGQIIGLKTK